MISPLYASRSSHFTREHSRPSKGGLPLHRNKGHQLSLHSYLCPFAVRDNPHEVLASHTTARPYTKGLAFLMRTGPYRRDF